MGSVRILEEMSLRRRGVREYSAERARRMSFFTRLSSEEAVVLVWVSASEPEAEESEDERWRRAGGEASEESEEGSLCCQ